jgi:hypothetical protein
MIIESRTIRWAGHLEGMEKKRNACRSSVEIPEKKRPTWKF